MSEGHAGRILGILHAKKGSYVSGQELADGLGVTRAAVWKAIESLRADGYVIESAKARGYMLAEVPDLLGAREIGLGLGTKYMGRTLVCLDEVDSTNSRASVLASDGAPEGTLVVADKQTKGRGRLGRRWVSPAGMNIYASVILRPRIAPATAPMITLVASVALVRAIRGLYGLDAGIKWPNDLLIGGRKAAGILTEMSADQDMVRHIVLGIGVDVNMPSREFPKDIRGVSTSVMIELGRRVNRADLLRSILAELERGYAAFRSGDRAGLLDDWRALSGMLGRKVSVTTLSGSIEGTAVDVDEDGYLLVRKNSGEVARITSGDVGLL